jgi:hypothetical protein
LDAYKTGKGSFRVRARWEKEEGARGTWQIVVTEIPYQVQKSKLIERIAELLEQKKLPLLDDIHDESAEDIRVVLTPKSRTVDPEILMEQLFRSSDLEARISLNMNVLDKGLGAQGDEPEGGPCGLRGAPPRGAGAALGFPPGEDQGAAGGAGRLSRGLPEPGQGHQDHPH